MRATRVRVPGYDEVYRLEDPDGYVALHRTRQGPAFGGTRLRDYGSEREALEDALRLAEAMTRKYAIHGLPFGGGKAVLLSRGLRDRRDAYLALGDFVESLGGRFLTGSDLGTSPADVLAMRERTRHVECEDGSEASAQSVLWALRGALRAARGDDSLQGLTVAVQGLGALGGRLGAKCAREGASVLGSDVDARRRREARNGFRVRLVPPEDILSAPADVLAPCAIGGAVHPSMIGSLRCRWICGGANNILDRDSTAEALHDRGIVYVPDFLANSGAAVEGAWTRLKGPGDHSARIAAVGPLTFELLREAERSRRPPLRVALDRVRDGLSR